MTFVASYSCLFLKPIKKRWLLALAGMLLVVFLLCMLVSAEKMKAHRWASREPAVQAIG